MSHRCVYYSDDCKVCPMSNNDWKERLQAVTANEDMSWTQHAAVEAFIAEERKAVARDVMERMTFDGTIMQQLYASYQEKAAFGIGIALGRQDTLRDIVSAIYAINPLRGEIT